MEEIIYFEIDNWFAGRDYPNIEPINTWVKNNQFSDGKWCRENKLCVIAGAIDMSLCWCVTAPRSWVEKNCPDLLSDEELEYAFIITSKDGQTRETHTYKATDFLCHPDEDGYVEGRVSGWEFLEYKEENFGVKWDYSYWNNEEDYDDEDEENNQDENE